MSELGIHNMWVFFIQSNDRNTTDRFIALSAKSLRRGWTSPSLNASRTTTGPKRSTSLPRSWRLFRSTTMPSTSTRKRWSSGFLLKTGPRQGVCSGRCLTKPKRSLVLPYSPTSYATFATGRENIQSLTCDFDLIGRHNLITLAFEYILGFFFSVPAPEDVIKIEIVPNAKILPFVFAIVNKNHMQSAREKNYFLSLTRTADSDKLPSSFVFMTESNELTQLLFSEDLSSAVHRSQSFCDSLPLLIRRRKNLPQSRHHLWQTLPHFDTRLSKDRRRTWSVQGPLAGHHLICRLCRELQYQLHHSSRAAAQDQGCSWCRDAQDPKGCRAGACRGAGKEKAEEKREQRSKISKLSPKEQLKIEQKEREKEMRKMRQKQSKRMWVG